jgi:hypothetical protein
MTNRPMYGRFFVLFFRDYQRVYEKTSGAQQSALYMQFCNRYCIKHGTA